MFKEAYEMIDVGGRAKRPGKMNLWITLAAMFGVSSILGTGAYYGYRYYSESINEGFLRGTCVDGEDVYGLSPAQTTEKILAKYADSEIAITEGENTDLDGNLASYGYAIDGGELQTELESAFKAQKSDRKAIFDSVFDRYEQSIEVKPEEDKEVFEKKVSVANLGVARYPSEDAALYYDKESDSIAIRPEIQGNEISDEDLRAFVRSCIEKTLEKEQATAAVEPGNDEEAEKEPQGTGEGLHRTFEFPWDLCEKPKVYADDEKLVSTKEAVNEYAGAGITYTFGEKTEEYDLLALADLMDIEDGKAELSDEKIEAFVEDLASRYNTRYLERKFESTLAGEITIPAKYNDYGYTIIQEDEAGQLREDIESRRHVIREPVYLEKNSWGNPYYLRRNGEDDLDGTYIEVDLTAQHVWYYKDGEVYTETDCVSGDVTEDHGTRTGCFPLAYKESPSVLTGGEGDDEYEEKVEYWMPFFEGQGLHDASWRYYFGGNIYRGNGSHGCVNLPTSKAGEIYEAVETGTAIIIFYE